MAVDDFPRSHGSLSGLTGTDHHLQYALVISGPAAARPNGPWRNGRMYYATDTGVLSWDQGAGWIDFASGASVAAVQASVDDLAALQWMRVGA